MLISADGLVVAPSVRIAKAGDGASTFAAADIAVVGHPKARCEAILAVQGELALLRLSGLFSNAGDEPSDADAAPNSVGQPGVAEVGEFAVVVGGHAESHTLGFVTGLDRHPGMSEADAPVVRGCGQRAVLFRENNPPVLVGSALVHDAGWAPMGSLLIDGMGRPLAVNVSTQAPGVTFAVPWAEAMARFAGMVCLLQDATDGENRQAQARGARVDPPLLRDRLRIPLRRFSVPRRACQREAAKPFPEGNVPRCDLARDFTFTVRRPNVGATAARFGLLTLDVAGGAGVATCVADRRQTSQELLVQPADRRQTSQALLV